VGGEVGVRLFDDEFPLVDERQRLVEEAKEGTRGFRGYVSLIRRLRWGAVVQGGLQYERDELDATLSEPAEKRSRTSVNLELELNRHDRLLFPTRGGALKASLGKSVSGDDLWRFELKADLAKTFGPASRQTLTGRIGLGLSDRADRRPYWFDPGGYRSLYGFIPYGASAPQYAHAGVTWRLEWFDLGAARVYLEAGLDALRTSLTRSDLRHGDGALGAGASLIAYTRLLGPITLGVARSDAGADTVFLTAGYSFVDRVGN
jgi:hypothetical protein